MTKNTRVAFYATRIYVVALLAGVICFIIYNNPIKVKMEPVLIIAAIAVILAAFFCGASYRVKKIGAEKSSFTTDKLVISALLIAIGILIPLIMPKVVIEPMSFTLFSHVAIFVGMFISTDVAIAVVIGTTAGFFVSGFSPVVVLRAFSHIVFATIGSVYLKHNPKTIHSPIRFHVFSFVLALVHASCEVLVVIVYYVSIGGMAGLTDAIGFKVLFLLVGLGSAVHSMVDFEFAGGIVLVLSKQTKLFPNTMLPKTDKQNKLVAE
jgi:niacin transporter